MVSLGYTLSSEEFRPNELVANARRAEETGFAFASISDHFHPWLDSQGHAPFVWSTLGGIAQVTERMRIMTGVTAPLIRIHPVILAQAVATVADMLPGRFLFGVGTGEFLNEHITGAHWPPISKRQDMMIEAIELIRKLWEGKYTTHYGEHYTVENARIYTLPDAPPPVLVSGFGPKAIELAGRIGDGFVSTTPDADAIRQFREAGGAGKVTSAGAKVCWGTDEDSARKTAYRLWPNSGLPGELSQVLPVPRHFEQASSLVTEDMIGESIVCGPDVDRHVEAVQQYVDAGFDEVYVGQIGPDFEGFFEVYEREVLPRLR